MAGIRWQWSLKEELTQVLSANWFREAAPTGRSHFTFDADIARMSPDLKSKLVAASAALGITYARPTQLEEGGDIEGQAETIAQMLAALLICEYRLDSVALLPTPARGRRLERLAAELRLSRRQLARIDHWWRQARQSATLEIAMGAAGD